MVQAFVPFSSFAPRPSLAARSRAAPCAPAPPRRAARACVAPRHVRRAEEIKRLTKQLEDLRAKRANLGTDQAEGATPAAAQPSAAAAPAAAAASTPPPPSPSSPPPTPPPAPSAADIAAERPAALGQHSAGSRFLSITSVASDELIPRILPVVGHVPGLSAAVLQGAEVGTPQGTTGAGSLYTMDVSRTPFPMLAVETTEALSACGDPVCVTVDATRVSAAKLPVVDGGRVVLIVDRDVAGEKLSDSTFYVWDVDGRVEIGWVTEVPAQNEMRLIGRVAYGMIEVDPELRKKKSAWEEENETYA